MAVKLAHVRAAFARLSTSFAHCERIIIQIRDASLSFCSSMHAGAHAILHIAGRPAMVGTLAAGDLRRFAGLNTLFDIHVYFASTTY
jgi:hypothetical protein